MEVGVGVRCITPRWPVPLAGYGSDRIGVGVHDDLFVKCIYFAAAQGRCLVIAVDLLGLGREVVDAIKGALRPQLQESEILVAASHTHSGPAASARTDDAWAVDVRYVEALQTAAVEAALEALETARSCTLSVGRATCEIVINRRREVDGVWHLKPNEDGIRDEEVLVLRAQDETDQTRAVLFSYSCHPTIVCTDQVSADYPGRAQAYVQERIAGTTVVFLQGYEGDVRPRMLTPDGESFRSGDWDDVARMGDELGEAVMQALAGDMQPVAVDEIRCEIADIALPYSEVPTEAQLQETAVSDDPRLRAWAKLLLAQGPPVATSVPFRVQRLSLGDDLHLVAMEGEICLGYALALKRLAAQRGQAIVPVGIANGLVQYIPTAQVRREGGYGSSIPFEFWGLAGPFGPEVEKIIHRELGRMLGVAGESL